MTSFFESRILYLHQYSINHIMITLQNNDLHYSALRTKICGGSEKKIKTSLFILPFARLRRRCPRRGTECQGPQRHHAAHAKGHQRHRNQIRRHRRGRPRPDRPQGLCREIPARRTPRHQGRHRILLRRAQHHRLEGRACQRLAHFSETTLCGSITKL